MTPWGGDNRRMSSPVTVCVSHRFLAPAERVFDAWLNPTQASRFLFATRTGNIMRCQIEPWEGGHFTVTDRRPQADGDESVFDAEHHGTYVEIARPRRLVFDFGVGPGVEETSRVTIRIEPMGATACELHLSHDLGDGEDALAYEAQTRKGWTTILATLEREWFPRRILL
jgi:uncharacterized protein YndB with AHSA1/START domain